ncbi:MAG: type II toxin-antitoxin system VapC family toxin [Leptospirillia bacterium]
MTRDAHSCVLDASALLAFLHGEPGEEAVRSLLPGSRISAVNWSEVVQTCLARSVDWEGLRDDLAVLGMTILPMTPEDAEEAGRLWSPTKDIGLSLGDRACLALAKRLGLPAITMDRTWALLEHDEIVIRVLG